MVAIKKKKPAGGAGAYGSMQKAFAVLELLAERSPRGVTEIADTLRLEKSSVSRLLKTLGELGYVVQSSRRGQYQVGARVLLLAEHYLRSDRLVVEARPFLRELAQQARASAHLGVVVENQMILVAKEASPESIQVTSRVGGRIAPHASALGKVLLAGLSDDRLGDLLPSPLPRFTEKTVTDPAKLRKSLADIRRKGCAWESGEEHRGVGCIGVPVRDAEGRWIAALSVSGPLHGTPFRLGPKLLTLIRRKADALSRRMSSTEDDRHGIFSLAE